VKAAKPSAAAKRASVATPAGLKLGKDALRAEVEKLERANTTLRAKGKKASRAAKASALRIAELEAQVAALEQKAASSPAPVKCGPTAARAMAQEPAQLDEAVEAAVEKLEEDLGDF
jgi:hypothetical protein